MIKKKQFFTEETLSPARTATPDILLLERHSPVGAESEEEDQVSKEDVRDEIKETNDLTWEGWEEHDALENKWESPSLEDNETNLETELIPIKSNAKQFHKSVTSKNNKPLDLHSLDIKVSGGKSTASKEDSFFADMEPAIPKSLCLLDILEEKVKENRTNESEAPPTEASIRTKFAVAVDTDVDTEVDGWGEADWGEEF